MDIRLLRRQGGGVKEAIGCGRVVVAAGGGFRADAGADAGDLVVVQGFVADEGGRDGVQLGDAALQQPPHALLRAMQHRHHLHVVALWAGWRGLFTGDADARGGVTMGARRGSGAGG